MANPNEKTWRAVLEPIQVQELFFQVRAANPLNDAQARKALDAALEATEELMSVEYPVEGGMKAKRPEAREEYLFSERDVRGFKLALVQAINGIGQQRIGEAQSHVRRAILPLAAALRIESYVRKESGYDAKDEGGEVMKPDGGAPAAPTIVETKVAL